MTTSAPADPPFVELRGIHTYYGRSHILRGVDFHVDAGETLALMGRNGMGKTTLIRTLMGLVPPRSGTVLINGRDMTTERTFRRAEAGLAYVPEGRGIFASLTVRENLTMAARPPTGATEPWTYERVLETFPRLGQRLTNYGDQLSGGEQQMLAIGRALMTNPRLLILDEATEGLAPLIRDEIWRTIGVIRSSGLATIIVDKTVAAVSRVADRVIILAKGAVVFNARPSALAADPQFMHRHLGV